MSYGIISVKSGSTRLPGKCFFDFGEGNVLQHVIRRAKHFGFTPIVATTDLSEDDRVEWFSLAEDVLVHRGKKGQKLQQWHDICQKHGLTEFVTLDCDDLYFDPDLALQALDMIYQDWYDIIYPPKNAYAGSFSFAMTADIVKKACTLIGNDYTEMQWHFIEKVEGVRKTPLPVELGNPDIRLTLDYPEDYWLLDFVRREVGHFATRAEIEGLFSCNPDLYKINFFRNEQMLDGQGDGGTRLL